MLENLLKTSCFLVSYRKNYTKKLSEFAGKFGCSVSLIGLDSPDYTGAGKKVKNTVKSSVNFSRTKTPKIIQTVEF
jgi:hypothetical protein